MCRQYDLHNVRTPLHFYTQALSKWLKKKKKKQSYGDISLGLLFTPVRVNVTADVRWQLQLRLQPPVSPPWASRLCWSPALINNTFTLHAPCVGEEKKKKKVFFLVLTELISCLVKSNIIHRDQSMNQEQNFHFSLRDFFFIIIEQRIIITGRTFSR